MSKIEKLTCPHCQSENVTAVIYQRYHPEYCGGSVSEIDCKDCLKRFGFRSKKELAAGEVEKCFHVETD